MLAPDERIRVSCLGGTQRVRGWTGSKFETIRVCYGDEADDVRKVLERVLECQRRDLLETEDERGT